MRAETMQGKVRLYPQTDADQEILYLLRKMGATYREGRSSTSVAGEGENAHFTIQYDDVQVSNGKTDEGVVEEKPPARTAG